MSGAARSRRIVLLVIALTGSATACSALLGIQDVPPDDAGVGDGGGATPGIDGTAPNATGGGSDAGEGPPGDGGGKPEGTGRTPPSPGDDVATDDVATGDLAGDDVGSGPPDDGGAEDAPFNCSNPGFLPDAATATNYGSCTVGSTCDEYGDINMTSSSTQVGERESLCTSSFSGTWSLGPCSRVNAVFGCQDVSRVGNLCAEVDTSWYYGPTGTIDAAATYCPNGAGTIVYP